MIVGRVPDRPRASPAEACGEGSVYPEIYRAGYRYACRAFFDNGKYEGHLAPGLADRRRGDGQADPFDGLGQNPRWALSKSGPRACAPLSASASRQTFLSRWPGDPNMCRSTTMAIGRSAVRSIRTPWARISASAGPRPGP